MEFLLFVSGACTFMVGVLVGHGITMGSREKEKTPE